MKIIRMKGNFSIFQQIEDRRFLLRSSEPDSGETRVILYAVTMKFDLEPSLL